MKPIPITARADEFERVVDVVDQPCDQTDGLECVASVRHHADSVMSAERGDVANDPDSRSRRRPLEPELRGWRSGSSLSRTKAAGASRHRKPIIAAPP
jgi:hypothetical protein